MRLEQSWTPSGDTFEVQLQCAVTAFPSPKVSVWLVDLSSYFEPSYDSFNKIFLTNDANCTISFVFAKVASLVLAITKEIRNENRQWAN